MLVEILTSGKCYINTVPDTFMANMAGIIAYNIFDDDCSLISYSYIQLCILYMKYSLMWLSLYVFEDNQGFGWFWQPKGKKKKVKCFMNNDNKKITAKLKLLAGNVQKKTL